jgi:hypothetical protein
MIIQNMNDLGPFTKYNLQNELREEQAALIIVVSNNFSTFFFFNFFMV